MIKLISHFNNAEGNVLAQKLFLLRQKYLDDEYIANNLNNFFREISIEKTTNY